MNNEFNDFSFDMLPSFGVFTLSLKSISFSFQIIKSSLVIQGLIGVFFLFWIKFTKANDSSYFSPSIFEKELYAINFGFWIWSICYIVPIFIFKFIALCCFIFFFHQSNINCSFNLLTLFNYQCVYLKVIQGR